MQGLEFSNVKNIDGISFRPICAVPKGEAAITGDNIYKPELFDKCIDPGLVIIGKYSRENQKDSLLAKYYCYDGTILAAPDLFSLLYSKLREGTHFLRKSYESVYENLQWTPEREYNAKSSKKDDTFSLFREIEYSEEKDIIINDLKQQVGLVQSFLEEIKQKKAQE